MNSHPACRANANSIGGRRNQTMNKSIRNGEIELWRMIFCLAIFIYHFSLDYNGSYALFYTGQIGVEFFFLASGLFLARTAEKMNQTKPSCQEVGSETLYQVVRKYISFFPYHVVAFGFGFLLSLYQNHIVTPTGIIRKAIQVLPQFFLIHLNGMFEESRIVTIEWYLSALLIGCLMLYPVLRMAYEKYVYWIGPVLSLFIMGYMYHTDKTLFGPVAWEGFTCRGVFRGIMVMNLGMLAYELAKKLQARSWKMGQRIGFTVLNLLCYFVPIYAMTKKWENKEYFTLIFFLFAGITISFAQNVNLYGRYLNHGFFLYLGKLSLPMYLNTNMVRILLRQTDLVNCSYPVFFFTEIFVNAVISMALVFVVEKHRTGSLRTKVLSKEKMEGKSKIF